MQVMPVAKTDLDTALDVIGRERITAGGIDLAELEAGDVMLWLVLERDLSLRALFATAIMETKGEPFVEVAGLAGFVAGGASRLVRAIDARMQEHAQRMRCVGVRFVGRDAYKRMLPQYRVKGLSGAWPVFERRL